MRIFFDVFSAYSVDFIGFTPCDLAAEGPAGAEGAKVLNF